MKMKFLWFVPKKNLQILFKLYAVGIFYFFVSSNTGSLRAAQSFSAFNPAAFCVAPSMELEVFQPFFFGRLCYSVLFTFNSSTNSGALLITHPQKVALLHSKFFCFYKLSQQLIKCK